MLKCPQSSELGPFLFFICIHPLGDLIQFHTFKYQIYADDFKFKPTVWTSRHYIQLPMPHLLIGTPVVLMGLKLNSCCSPPPSLLSSSLLHISQCQLHPSSGSGQRPWSHPCLFIFSYAAKNVSKSSQCYNKNIHRIWCLLAVSTAKTLVQAIIVSHLDYWNSLPTGLTAPGFAVFWFNRDSSQRILLEHMSNLVTPLIRPPSLQWLPVPLMVKASPLCDQAALTSSATALPLVLGFIMLLLKVTHAPFPWDLYTCSFCLDFSYPRYLKACSASTHSLSALTSLVCLCKCFFLSKAFPVPLI